MPNWTQQRSAIVFVVAFVFIALFQIFVPDSFRLDSSDYTYYHSVVARNLLAGNGFTLADDSFASTNPPGYPIIVAVLLWIAQLGISEALLFGALNAACLAISVVVVYRLARNLWGERGGLLAAGLWLTYPFMLLLSTERLTEPPFIAALYLGLAFFWRSLKTQSLRGFALAAVFLGIAMLIRSIAIAILPVCVLIVWLTRHPLRLKASTSAVLLGVGSLVVLPWTILVYAQSSQLVVLGTNTTPSIRDGLTFAVGKAYRQEFQISADVLALMERLLSRRDEMTSLGAIFAAVREEFLQTPDAVVKLFLLKIARSWFATDSGRLELLSLAIQALYLLGILVGSLLTFRFALAQRTYLLGTWLIVLYFWLMTIAVLSILRYMTPAMGLLMTIVPIFFMLRQADQTKMST